MGKAIKKAKEIATETAKTEGGEITPKNEKKRNTAQN